MFGNVVTLSVGSIPMQSAYLHRKGMEPGEAAGIMSMEYVLHKSTILLCSSVLLLLEGQKLFRQHRNLLRYVVFGYSGKFLSVHLQRNLSIRKSFKVGRSCDSMETTSRCATYRSKGFASHPKYNLGWGRNQRNQVDGALFNSIPVHESDWH